MKSITILLYLINTQNAVGKKLFKTNDNHVLFYASTIEGFTSNDPYLAKITYNGDVVWTQKGYYRYFGWNIWPSSITPNNAILFCGHTSPDPNWAIFARGTASGVFRAPILFTPSHNDVQVVTNPVLRLSSTTHTLHFFSQFQYQIARDSLFSNIVLDQTSNRDTLAVSGLSGSTTYYWRVRGYGYGTTYTPWSSVFKFTTRFVASLPFDWKGSKVATLSLYPDPAAQEVMVEVPAAVTRGNLMVYNQVGVLQKMLSGVSSARLPLALHDLPSWVVFCCFRAR